MSVKKRRRRQKKRTGIDQATANKIRFEKEVETLTNEFLNNPDYCPLLENSDYLLEYYPDTFRDLDNIKELDGKTIAWDREKEELVNMKREIFLQWAKENDETIVVLQSNTGSSIVSARFEQKLTLLRCEWLA